MPIITLAVLISGRGSNMAALIDACRKPDFPARIACVLSNNPDAPGLITAQNAGIPTHYVDHRDFDDRLVFEQALVDTLAPYRVDWVCLAGFMRLLRGPMFEAYTDKIINVHPSLLPAYKGLNVHERVIAAGETRSGCSVHIVVPETDAGPVLVQRDVPVMPDDTPDTLSARILVQEHLAYPEAIMILAKTYKG